MQIFPSNELIFKCTTHQTSYFTRLHSLLFSAKISISLAQYVFSISISRPWQRSNKILDLLIAAHKTGLPVHVLFDRPKPRNPNFRTNIKTAESLAAAGIIVRCLTVLKTLHIKFLIIDSTFFIAGSHNLTNSSLYSPFELSFETSDPSLVSAASTYFYSLWNGNLSEDFFTVLKSISTPPKASLKWH
jgi:phosphatidylserine/phosphatidylglycerophosphate/cardiolipin synthase-like enzyme